MDFVEGDGQQPKCGRCVSRNLECVFEKSSKKRGPEAGTLTSRLNSDGCKQCYLVFLNC
jgi:hypothetical protein